MRLGARIRGLERSAQRAGAGTPCTACGLPRVAGGGAYRGATITAIGPRVIKHITEIECETSSDPELSCMECGRALVFRIPPPVPARSAAGREAA